jgi:hypothetical protein
MFWEKYEMEGNDGSMRILDTYFVILRLSTMISFKSLRALAAAS